MLQITLLCSWYSLPRTFQHPALFSIPHSLAKFELSVLQCPNQATTSTWIFQLFLDYTKKTDTFYRLPPSPMPPRPDKFTEKRSCLHNLE